jgi:hypothetical protein
VSKHREGRLNASCHGIPPGSDFNFTGSYRKDLGENATVSLLGRTFTIAGTADGFNVQDPSKRTPGEFSIKVSC